MSLIFSLLLLFIYFWQGNSNSDEGPYAYGALKLFSFCGRKIPHNQRFMSPQIWKSVKQGKDGMCVASVWLTTWGKTLALPYCMVALIKLHSRKHNIRLDKVNARLSAWKSNFVLDQVHFTLLQLSTKLIRSIFELRPSRHSSLFEHGRIYFFLRLENYLFSFEDQP